MAMNATEAFCAWTRLPFYCGNVYLTPRQLDDFLLAENVEVIEGEGAFFVLENTGLFSRLHYFAESKEHLDKALVKLLLQVAADRSVVVDILQRNGKAAGDVAAFGGAGFEQLGRLTRMNMAPIVVSVDRQDADLTIERAGAFDASEILIALEKAFDTRVSRLPDLSTVACWAEEGGVFVARLNGVLAGVALFKDYGSMRPCLDQLLTISEYRGMGVATSLLEEALSHFDARQRPYLWAVDSALSYYEKIGFTSDGLTDTIMVYERR